MTRSPLSVLMTVLLAGAMLPGCSQPQPEAADTATTAPTPAATEPEAAQPEASADAFGFKIGTLDATALKDGDLDAPNDCPTFAPGQPTEEVAALLAPAGAPPTVLHLRILPRLVRGDGRVQIVRANPRTPV